MQRPMHALTARHSRATSIACGLAAVALAAHVSAAEPQSQPPTGSAFADCLLRNGLGFGPFRDGQSPDADVYPTPEQIQEDLLAARQWTNRIRTYDTKGAFGLVPAIARELGMTVSQGVPLGKNPIENEARIAEAIQLAQAGLVDELIVGNEVLTGDLLSKAELVSYLRRVRQQVPGFVSVGTAETWNQWEANLDIARDVDFVVGHFYPFWEGHPLAGAAANVIQRYRALETLLRAEYPARSLRLVIGETGWPSAGQPLADGVVPDPANQRVFAEEFVMLACEQQIPFYYFQIWDEEWKWQEGASSRLDDQDFPLDRNFSGRWIGSSWGFAHSNGALKVQFGDLLAPLPAGSRRQRDIFANGQLATYYDIGVDTFLQQRDWLSVSDDSLRMAYPAGQVWGAVFITVGKPAPPPRPWRDFSAFGVLSLELRGESGGESVSVGIKDATAADDGSERKESIEGLTTEFQRYDIPLLRFSSSRFVVPDDLAGLYVVVEFVFSGLNAQTVYARNIRYLPAD